MGLKADLIEATEALKSNIPGLSSWVDEDPNAGAVRVRFRYLCPCGEVSGLGYAFIHRQVVRKEYFIQQVVSELRAHVISEGNTPNF
jgi:hypothetical protein